MLAIAGSCGFTSSGYDAGLGVLRLQNGGKPRRGGAEDQCDAETDDDDAVVESAGAAHRRRSPAVWWGGVMMSRRRYGDMTGAGPGSASYCRNRLWRRPAAFRVGGLGYRRIGTAHRGCCGVVRRCYALHGDAIGLKTASAKTPINSLNAATFCCWTFRCPGRPSPT